MALVQKNILKNWFVTAAKPTQEQFWAWMDSYWHKDESIPTSKIAGLDDLFSGVATTEQLAAKANKDASNIEETDRTAWRDKLGVGDLPKDLVYTADLSNYYTRNETNNLLDNKLDYPEGENGSSTIPAQLVGLDADGESIQVNPDYFATKSDLADYYSIVEAPDPSKVYLLNVDGTPVAADSFGKNLANSNLTQSAEDRTYNQNSKSLTFTGGAFNVQGATNFQNATQQFSGLLDKSSDATYNRLGGLNSSGNFAEVGLYAMTNEMSKATDAMKDAWRIASRKSGETYSTGQPVISFITPPIINNSIEHVQFFSLVGSNLFVDNQTPNAFIEMENNTTKEINIIENFTVSQQSPNIISIGLAFPTVQEGVYNFYVTHNGIRSLLNQNATLTVVSSLTTITKDPFIWDMIVTDTSNQSVTESEFGFIYNKTSSSGSTNRVYKTQNAVVTQSDIQNGCLLLFDINYFNNLDSYSNFKSVFGFEPTSVALNSSLSVTNSIQFEKFTIRYFPSNKTYSATTSPTQSDRLYVIIKNGTITYFFENKGFIYVTTFNYMEDISIKLSFYDTTSYVNYFSFYLVDKFLL